jgi:hypothetical protein
MDLEQAGYEYEIDSFGVGGYSGGLLWTSNQFSVSRRDGEYRNEMSYRQLHNDCCFLLYADDALCTHDMNLSPVNEKWDWNLQGFWFVHFLVHCRLHILKSRIHSEYSNAGNWLCLKK